MTDPSGKSFLSYRRSRASEAALLITAQHLHGIPTWQDIHDLDTGLTEREIEDMLESSAAANAIAWITPDVAESSFIQKVELPKILERANDADDFFCVAVAAGGLDYDGAASVLKPAMSMHDLRRWNQLTAKSDPIDYPFAAEVAGCVLKQRLKAIHEYFSPDAPLKLHLSTWPGYGNIPGAALVLDWHTLFNNRLAPPHEWQEKLLPALRTVHQMIRTYAPARAVEASGNLSFAAAIALGIVFRQPGGVPIAWRQHLQDLNEQPWSLKASRTALPLEIKPPVQGNVDSEDLAVLVSIAASARSVENGFAASRSALPEFRAVLQIAGERGQEFVIGSASEAVDIAWQVREAIRNAVDKFHPIGTIHLFFAGPVGLTMLIGQLLNGLPEVQVYEYIPSKSGNPYQSSLKLDPCI